MLKIDVEPITPKLLNKQTAHSAYIKHTQEEATVLRDLVEHVKSKYPLDKSLKSACRLTGRTFTIVGNACPLTSYTTTTEVPLRKPTALENETPKSVVTLVYSRKPRKSKTNVPISKYKGIFFGPLRVASVNGKKYILVIVDDYSRFTCEASDTQQVRTALHEMTHATTSSGLVQNPPPSTSFVPPSRTDLEIDPSPDKCALLLYIGIYKVKLDEFGGILRTVSRLVARGYVKNKELILRNPFAPVARLDDPFRIFSHMLIT
ncbi:hypothetical protein Tco_0713597 [Tanacetum coccineum]